MTVSGPYTQLNPVLLRSVLMSFIYDLLLWLKRLLFQQFYSQSHK